MDKLLNNFIKDLGESYDTWEKLMPIITEICRQYEGRFLIVGKKIRLSIPTKGKLFKSHTIVPEHSTRNVISDFCRWYQTQPK
jgi:hypothetical protein